MASAPGSTTPARHPNTAVILFAPELFTTPPDLIDLRTTLARPPTRLLIRLTAATDIAFAQTLAAAGIDVQLLVPTTINPPSTTLPTARMPPGSNDTETNNLALALSDALLVPASRPANTLIETAQGLDKPLITPGAEPPQIAHPRHPITHRLDLENPGWHRRAHSFWGRTEQFFLELAAFGWLGIDNKGIPDSFGKLRACLPWHERTYDPYFASETWKTLAPDRATLDDKTPLVADFKRLDRSAVYGSYVHRDLVWYAYFFSAFAVFAAVTGHLTQSEWVWPIVELLSLLFIAAAIGFVRICRLQDRWTACRRGAEQLRIARMCLPLLVTPPAFNISDTPATKDYAAKAIAEVQRAIRDHGLPDLSPTLTATEAARWLHLIVTGQTHYHRDNRKKLHCAEERLKWAAGLLFVLALAAVCVHLFICDAPILLIFTAALPAAAAAVHGVTTRLGFVHRKDLSHEVEAHLEPIGRRLHHLIANPGPPETMWPEIRRMALDASYAMEQENRSWHGQVRRQKDDFT